MKKVNLIQKKIYKIIILLFLSVIRIQSQNVNAEITNGVITINYVSGYVI